MAKTLQIDGWKLTFKLKIFKTPNEDEPKEAQTKTHYNQTIRSQRQRENLESSKRKVTSCPKDLHYYETISQQKP